MSNDKTLTRAELSNSVYREIGLSLVESADLVDSFFDEVSGSLSKGEDVKLTSFGTFHVREKAARVGRNPKTGVEAPIAARKVVTFNASNILKDKVKGGN